MEIEIQTKENGNTNEDDFFEISLIPSPEKDELVLW